MNNAKKITLTTIKSFIRKSGEQLHFVKRTAFDGMQDMVSATGNKELVKAIRCEEKSHNHGVTGAWFVGSSRDYFQPYNDGKFQGFKVSNCCGEFILAVPVAG